MPHMKQEIQKRFSFYGKSILWSLLLYSAVMLTLNWDEVSHTITGNNRIKAVITNAATKQSPQVAIPEASQTGATNGIVTLIRVLSEIAGKVH